MSADPRLFRSMPSIQHDHHRGSHGPSLASDSLLGPQMLACRTRETEIPTSIVERIPESNKSDDKFAVLGPPWPALHAW